MIINHKLLLIFVIVQLLLIIINVGLSSTLSLREPLVNSFALKLPPPAAHTLLCQCSTM
jgi:hypothetical protein